MIEKNYTIEVPEDNPFIYDRFNREIIAKNLTRIIDSTNGSLVLTINSAWGKGKTTFLRMWKQKLDNSNKYKTFYFNAWENDDSNDPFLAIVSELSDEIYNKTEYDKVINKIRQFSKPLIKKILPTALKIATHNLIDINNYNESQITDLVGKLGEIELNDYKKIRESKKGFKEALKEFQMLECKKIVFFVDELDRCRPTFAVETLEKIKHLFDIENYIFVLALDKEQLSYSVQTLYGSNMDSTGYLRRFVDIEYLLPEPDRDKYIDFLLDVYKLKNGKKTLYLETYLKVLLEYYNLSLRDIDKLLYYLRLILPMTPLLDDRGYNDIYLEVLGTIYSFFPVLKLKKNELYQRFLRKDISSELFSIGGSPQLISLLNKKEIYKSNFNSILLSIFSLLDSMNTTDEIDFRKYNVGQIESFGGSMSLSYIFDHEKKELKFVNEMELIGEFVYWDDEVNK